MRFTKYQALGNDYLVLQEMPVSNSRVAASRAAVLQPELIRWICNRHLGVGADGILVAVGSLHDSLDPKQERNVTAKRTKGHEAQFAVRIFNPDGSEAEKSGNGLRIFARALFDAGLVAFDPFEVDTLGGRVGCQILDQGRQVRVEMGRVRFGPALSLALDAGLTGYIADVGNPHCVIFREAVSAEETQRLGPLIEVDPRFPQRTNVQFVRVIDRRNVQIEIWERGAGYTRASGSSSCAACAVAVRLGLCDPDVTLSVHMPGGILQVEVSPDFCVRQTGPVARVAHLDWSPA